MPEDLKILQLERLQAILNRVYKEVPFYRHLFDKFNFNPEDLSELEHLKKAPFTTKEDLRENYPYNMFAVPLREVVRILATSGTTGEPIVVGYTRNDLATLTEISSLALKNLGISKEDVLQITFHPGLFSSAFGIQSGAEKIGASVIPVHFEDPRKQLKILQDYRSTVLICSPSYALWLSEVLPQTGINPNSLMLKKIILCGEPFTEAQRNRLEETFKADVYNLYSITEVFGPGLAYECKEKKGLHFQEKHFLIEVINPETLDSVAPGEVGELVITTLTKEAFPLIRYRTGDLLSIQVDPCPCESPYIYTSPILGRRDDLIIVRGIKFHPAQVDRIMSELLGDLPPYQIHLLRIEGLEEVLIYLALGEKLFSDSFLAQEELRKKLEEKLLLEINLPIKVKFASLSSFEKGEGKYPKVIDKR
ncbi:phenylacetate--CoA ligase [Caldimicrobium thiodismutans]|uniref:Phenylacetate-coenzyme A ligase n=1 Tax=Caldimicrobium thiodismutans TaxID=1653476 RepID=A0A0U5BYG3_9BACT|nr:phenylacetate--CoA ligase [Caldimicrobium thiodismutans]BAU23829.1 phenylacetate--CoA ligase [Caldimicrobium thiodismutans]